MTKPKKMQRQLFIYAFLLPLVALVLFALVVYFYVSGILIDREHVTLQGLNSSQMTQIEGNLQVLDYVTADINYTNRLTGFLTDSEDWASDPQVSDFIFSIVGLERKAYQVNLQPLRGAGAEVGISGSDAGSSLDDLQWQERVLALKGKKLLSAPYYGTRGFYSGSGKWLLSISRAALDDKNRVIGTLEAVGRCEQIFAPAISYSHQNRGGASLYIFDASGAQIYPYDVTDEQREATRPIFSDTEENPDAPGEVRGRMTGAAYQYVRASSAYSGWTYITLQSRDIVFQPVYRLIALLAAVAVALSLLCALLAWLFARGVVKSVSRLRHMAQKLRLDTLGQSEPDGYTSPFEELDELYREFQTMRGSLQGALADLESSRELEFKAQMTALQMQMNPHFYHSTLACISALAESGRTEEVSSMCRTLSDLMHYITDAKNAEVLLFQELSIVRKYLYCMKMRYQENLDIVIDTDEALNAIPVPKLILEPLVENAVKYGTDCLPPWSVRITGRMESDRWYFVVEDGGGGFSQESLISLEDRIAHIDRTTNADLTRRHIDSMGLINVYLRWKLHCRGSEIFEYGNTPDGHAYVRIGRKLN